MAETHSHESAGFLSLIDDAAFLAELEQLEGKSAAAPVTRPVHARRPVGPLEPVIPRDVNRWNLYPPPGVEPEPKIRHQPSRVSAFRVILIGLCAGAAGAAFVFSERLMQVIELLAR